MTGQPIAQQIEINGIVQGVGFRPFVFQLACRHHLAGRVANTDSGVVIHVEGGAGAIDAFVEDLYLKKPPLALFAEMTRKSVTVAGLDTFTIAPSKGAHHRNTLISPDVSICADCEKELFDPDDRRYHYPFINCTNCGPRYTIIDDVPYDRIKTSMHPFTMCAQCRSEYDTPGDRRFHAQPNACPACGPRVTLLDNRRADLACGDPINRAVELIKEGAVVALKGLGGFHLAVDALNDKAVERLRKRKAREEKPFAVMVPDLDTAAAFCHIGEAEAELLTAIQRPIVLLPKKLPEKLAYSVAPRNPYYGVVLPYTPLHCLLMKGFFTALVMTSGNLSDDPIAIDNQDAFERLCGIADYFLIHNRDIYLRCDDSILRHDAGHPRFIRRSRGYAPVPIFLRRPVAPLLACGAELKNTICLTRGKQAFMSQHIGDLENLAAESFFQKTIDHLKRTLGIKPEAIACDLHPDYLSTQWAKQQPDAPVIQVQHHHAHIAACMAENKVDGAVIGLAFDGAGYGGDGALWGGELLLADAAGYRRAACFEPVPMPGGAAAVKEPWRMGLAYLRQAYGESLWDLTELPLLRSVNDRSAHTIVQMAEKSVNSPLTTSLGRLFDGVAAILGLRRTAAFEGQAAMELEMIADSRTREKYRCGWRAGPCKQIQTRHLIRAVTQDVLSAAPAFIISRKFHNTIIDVCADLCVEIRKESGLDRVVLGGGCFQNKLLFEGFMAALRAKHFDVYAHRCVPCNDGGLALGQAVIAHARLTGQKSEVV